MKRHGLLIATLLALPLTGLALAQAGWFTPQSPPTAQAASAPPSNPLHTGAGCHWRTCQPHHWRDCLLQH